MDPIRPIRALMRGLEALTVLNLRDGATVSEVAREIRLPRTTVHRILETLCDSGFVFRDAADERYRLTTQVRKLSTGFDEEAWVQVAKPHLIALSESIVWPLHIASFGEGKLTVREATDHSSPMGMKRCAAGMHLPLLGTAAGRVYLACCAEERRSAVLEHLAGSRQAEDRPARDHEELARLLREIRAQGYAVTAVRNRHSAEELSVSVPVALQDHDPAVLTVRFAAPAIPLKTGLARYLPKLRHCAAKIGAAWSQACAATQAGTRAGSTPRTAA